MHQHIPEPFVVIICFVHKALKFVKLPQVVSRKMLKDHLGKAMSSIIL